MTEAAEATPSPAKPKAKRRKKKQAAAVRPLAAVDEYAGVTSKTCCDGCNAERCVISGTPFCHHPLKTSHPTATTDIVARVVAVRNILKHQQVDKAG